MKLAVKICCLMLLGFSCSAQSTYYVLFEYDKAEVPDTAMAFLIKTVYKNDVSFVYLEGHCDSIGSRGYNYELSQRRVKAVEQLLIDNGFDAKKIEGKVGFGKDKPRAINSSAENRQKNRRVMVRFAIDGEKELPLSSAKKTTVEKPPQKKTVTKRDDFLSVTQLPESDEQKALQTPATKPKELKSENFTPNSVIALPNLLFQGGRHYLLNRSTPSLDTLLKILKAKPLLRIEIQGHVCCTTTEIDGFDFDTGTSDLSVRRAVAIKTFLIENGISSARLKTKGFGGSSKLFPKEETETEKQNNLTSLWPRKNRGVRFAL